MPSEFCGCVAKCFKVIKINKYENVSLDKIMLFKYTTFFFFHSLKIATLPTTLHFLKILPSVTCSFGSALAKWFALLTHNKTNPGFGSQLVPVCVGRSSSRCPNMPGLFWSLDIHPICFVCLLSNWLSRSMRVMLTCGVLWPGFAPRRHCLCSSDCDFRCYCSKNRKCGFLWFRAACQASVSLATEL